MHILPVEKQNLRMILNGVDFRHIKNNELVGYIHNGCNAMVLITLNAFIALLICENDNNNEQTTNAAAAT